TAPCRSAPPAPLRSNFVTARSCSIRRRFTGRSGDTPRRSAVALPQAFWLYPRELRPGLAKGARHRGNRKGGRVGVPQNRSVPMTALWLIVLCGVLAILYAIWAIRSVLAADAGSARMQEISAAVREGAQAYLKRQYTTIGIVGVVIFLIVGFFLGW